MVIFKLMLHFISSRLRTDILLWMDIVDVISSSIFHHEETADIKHTEIGNM